MIDLEKYTRSLNVTGDSREFKLAWKKVCGPEAKEGSPKKRK